MESEAIREARGLERMERMMVDAYDAVIARSDEATAETLAGFRDEHAEHAQRLAQVVRGAGAAATGYLIGVDTYALAVQDAIDAAITTEELLGQLRIVEAGLQLRYAEALGRVSNGYAWSVFADCFDDEACHQAFLEQPSHTVTVSSN